MQVQKRWCAVTSLGFQMFAPNRIPEEGEAPDLAIGWRELVDARPDAAPRGHSGERWLCFRVTFERGNEAQTLLFIQKDQQRLNQWIACLREGMEQCWKGVPRAGTTRPAAERSGTSKSKRALSSMVKKTETWWTSVAQRIDAAVEEVYRGMDFLAPPSAPKEDIESEFEDAASESDLSIRSEDSDGDAVAQPHKSRWTSHELVSRDRYLKEDQDLLDLLASDAAKDPKEAAAAAPKPPPLRSDSEKSPGVKRIPSAGALSLAGKSSSAAHVEGADRAILAGKRRGGSEVGGARGPNSSHRSAHDHQRQVGRACESKSDINGVGIGRAGQWEDDEGWESADAQDEDMSGSSKLSAHPSTKYSSAVSPDDNP
jgi:hypothetical protein